jgi:hypothetical protein
MSEKNSNRNGPSEEIRGLEETGQWLKPERTWYQSIGLHQKVSFLLRVARPCTGLFRAYWHEKLGDGRLGLPFSVKKKKFRGTRKRRKFLFIPSEFRLFRGMENARNSVPSRSAEDKKKTPISNHFVEGQKSSKFHSDNTWNFIVLFQTIPWKIIMLGMNSLPNPLAEEKNARNNFVPNQ